MTPRGAKICLVEKPKRRGNWDREKRSRNAKQMWASWTEEKKALRSARLSQALRGRKLSEDHRIALSLAHKGQVSWKKGKKETRPEVLAKMRLSHLGQKLSLERRKKLADSHRGRPVSIETRKKISDAQKGRPVPEYRKKILAIKCRGWTHSPAAKIKIAEASRRLWATSREKMLAGPREAVRAACRQPNGFERAVCALLEELFPRKWVYVGGGKSARKVGNHYPDFLCEEKSLIVEADGEYWHSDKSADARRNSSYRKLGYRVFTLGTKDLLDIKKLKQRVRSFYNAR